MKLIIDIDDYDLEWMQNSYYIPSELNTKMVKMILNGIPLKDIMSEIEQEFRDESEHPYGQGLRRAMEIIDKYREGEQE